MLNQSENRISRTASENLVRVPLCTVSISHSLRLMNGYLRFWEKKKDTDHMGRVRTALTSTGLHVRGRHVVSGH